MNRNALIIGVISTMLVTACSSQGTPTIDPLNVQQTAVAAAFTMVAQTQAAIPTATPPLPTVTPSPIPSPILTSLPSLTPDTLNTQLPALAPTLTQAPASSNEDPCNHPLTSWKGPSASLTISNETKPQGTIILSLYVVTDLGECGYLYVYSDSLNGPIGQYSAGAFVNGKQNFRVFGGFRITEGAWKIVVRNNSIVALGKCYPNC